MERESGGTRQGYGMCHTFASASGVGIGLYSLTPRRLRFRHVTLLFCHCQPLSLSFTPYIPASLLPSLSFPSVSFSILFYAIFTPPLPHCRLPLCVFFVFFSLFFLLLLRLFHVSYFTACALRQCVWQQQSTILNGFCFFYCYSFFHFCFCFCFSLSLSVCTLIRFRHHFYSNCCAQNGFTIHFFYCKEIRPKLKTLRYHIITDFRLQEIDHIFSEFIYTLYCVVKFKLNHLFYRPFRFANPLSSYAQVMMPCGS